MICRHLGFRAAAAAAVLAMISTPVPAQSASPATAPGGAPVLSPQVAPAEEAKINAAVARLGSGSAKVREEAARQLWSYGRRAEPALREAAAGDDPETAVRAKQVLDDFRAGSSPGTPPAVIANLKAYHDGRNDPARRARALDQLASAGAAAARPLLRLYADEADPAVRREVAARFPRAGYAAVMNLALGDGDDGLAESVVAELLAKTFDPKRPDPYFTDTVASDYAALLLARGRLDQKIADLARAVPNGPDPDRDTLLVYLYCAKGDTAAAKEAAERTADGTLAAQLALRDGDWRPTAELEAADPNRLKQVNGVLRDVGFKVMARDGAGTTAAIEAMTRWVDEHTETTPGPTNVVAAVHTLLLAGRYDEAVRFARAHDAPVTAFEILQLRGRWDEAAALADETARDAAPPPPPALPPPDAAAPAANPAQQRARQAEQAKQLEGWEKAWQRTEAGVTVRAMAARMWWDLGEAEKALAAADAVSAAVAAMPSFTPPGAAAPGLPAMGYRPRTHPSMTVWSQLAITERALGRFDKADRAAQAYAALNGPTFTWERSFDPVPSSLGVLYPTRPAEIGVLSKYFAAQFPGDAVPARRARVAAVLDGKTPAPPLAEWAKAMRAKAADAASPGDESASANVRAGTDLYNLATVLYGMNELAEAEACMEAAVLQQPNLPALSRIGRAAFEAGDWQKAADFYTRAARAEGNATVNLYQGSLALRRLGRGPEADAAVALAKVLPLANSATRLALADAMDQEGDAAGAREQIELASRLGRLRDTGGLDSGRAKAAQLAADGQFAAAAKVMDLTMLAAFRSNVELAGTASYFAQPLAARRWEARGLLQAGDSAAAARIANDIADALPTDVAMTVELVNAFAAAGRKTEADALFDKAWAWHDGVLKIHPGYAPGHGNAARLAAECGRRPAEALAHARRAVSLDGQNVRFLQTLAEACFQSGKRDEAVELARQCLGRDPRRPELKELLRRVSAAPATRPAS